MIEIEQSQPGSVFLGKRIYLNSKLTEALKMFENVPINIQNKNSTNVLPNTNLNSIAVNRGQQ